MRKLVYKFLLLGILIFTNNPILGEENKNSRIEIKKSFFFNTQGAGTSNNLGTSFFLPIVQNKNSVFFIDTLGFYNFPDWTGISSIMNTADAGQTFGGSVRLGYRLIPKGQETMYGINFGYDGKGFKGTYPSWGNYENLEAKTVYFQQLGAGLQISRKSWDYKLYGTYGIGKVEQEITRFAQAGLVRTIAIDANYKVSKNIKPGMTIFYETGDKQNAFGGLLSLNYKPNQNLSLTSNLSYSMLYGWKAKLGLSLSLGKEGQKALKEEKDSLRLSMNERVSNLKGTRFVALHDSCTVICSNDTNSYTIATDNGQGDSYCSEEESTLNDWCAREYGNDYTSSTK